MDEPEQQKPQRPQDRAGEAGARAARLARAMRANLRRRKEQERGRAVAPGPDEEPVEER